MKVRARLIASSVPERPAGAVLLLHGGASRRGDMMVSPTQLSVLRMIPIAERVKHVAKGRLAVFRLLNSVRGWDTHHTPVDDVIWALGQLRERFDADLDACLIGHSLGGRAALLAAAQPTVRSAVALAPWVYPSDGDRGASGRKILIVHGTQDRIASPANSAAVARSLGRTADVGYVRVAGGKHAMLKHHAVFDGLAADFAAATLMPGERSRAGRSLDGGGAAPPSSEHGIVGRVLAGEKWIDA